MTNLTGTDAVIVKLYDNPLTERPDDRYGGVVNIASVNEGTFIERAIKKVCMLLFILGFISCGDNDNLSKGKVDYDPTKPVKVTTFFPDSGRIRERVMLDGENFGSDPKEIKLYFNNKRAAVVSSTGTRMYAIVPRMPGENCQVAVVVGSDSVIYDQTFRYKVTTAVSTIAGNGTAANVVGPLEQSQIRPFQIAIDYEDNIFVGVEGNIGGQTVGMVRINETENIMELIAAFAYRYEGICVDNNTGMVYACVQRSIDSWASMSPADNWVPKFKFMNYIPGKYPTPAAVSGSMKFGGYNQATGLFYTRHKTGEIVELNPLTNEARIIYMTPQTGTSIGLDFDPLHSNMCYIAGYSEAGGLAHGIWRFDVTDPANTWEKISGQGQGHKDGDISQALFNNPYGLKFDNDGICYIADYGNYCIRSYEPATGTVTTVLGDPSRRGFQDGGKEDAMFHSPTAVAVGKDGTVYVVDRNNYRIRKLAIE